MVFIQQDHKNMNVSKQCYGVLSPTLYESKSGGGTSEK
jgi:hypothetical protein